MNSIFSYDSPMMQILTYIGDLIILNFIYLLCCLPIFTIGAAQAGMFTAMRVLNDKEDDSSAVAAFFRGFKSGFGKVTLAWGLILVVMALLAAVGILAYVMQLPVWLCVAPICVCAIFQSLVPAFHSRFDCTAMQLIRNSWFLLIAHPLRSIGTALLIWAPVIVFVWMGMYIFMMATPVWCTLYYSTAILFAELFLRKPFKTLVEEFNSRQAAQQGEAAGALPEAEKPEKIFSDVPTE